MKKIVKIIIFGVIAVIILIWFFYFQKLNTLTSTNFPLDQKWSIKLKNKIQSISISGNNYLLVQTPSTLYAIDQKSRGILWQHELIFQNTAVSIFARKNIIYVLNQNTLQALNENDGTLLWSNKINNEPYAWIVDASDDIVLINQVSNLIIAINAKNGSLIWQQPTYHSQVRSYIDNGIVYIPGDNIRAIDLFTGENIWIDKSQSPGGLVSGDGLKEGI